MFVDVTYRYSCDAISGPILTYKNESIVQINNYTFVLYSGIFDKKYLNVIVDLVIDLFFTIISNKLKSICKSRGCIKKMVFQLTLLFNKSITTTIN